MLPRQKLPGAEKAAVPMAALLRAGGDGVTTAMK
jgi:hypothetical protein